VRLVQVLFGSLFAPVGLLHLIRPDFFVRQVPSWVPRPRSIVAITGVAEAVIGICLVAGIEIRVAAIAAAGLLLSYTPVHVHALRVAPAPQRWREMLRFPVNAVYVAVAVWIAAR
jgi:uncharacterized membrane protein